MIPNISNEYISRCAYLNRVEHPNCPVFRIGEILRMAEPNDTERPKMLKKGAVIQINIKWNCNFDTNTLCLPVYSFSRFDLAFSSISAASGFNFRFTDKFQINGEIHRVVVKAYGLRFIVIVDGKAGKFHLIPLMLSIGAGLGLLSLATIVADCVLVYCTSKKKFYRDLKRFDYKRGTQEK